MLLNPLYQVSSRLSLPFYRSLNEIEVSAGVVCLSYISKAICGFHFQPKMRTSMQQDNGI